MYILKIIVILLTVSNGLCIEWNFGLVKNIIQELRKAAAKNGTNKAIHPDAGLDIYQFLRNYQYPVENHWVQTDDGYILRMQRLLGGKNGTFLGKSNKPAVLLMHGLLSNPMDFLNMGPGKSLGLLLADAGYDVWLGNNRGTTWSRNHFTLDPDNDPEFWDYSFETCGYYDLPAKIDYIIKKTGQKKIFYVGHSQGTTQFFAMAALRPEYNDKIALMSALAPVAYMEHLSSPIIRLMAIFADLIELLFVKILHWNELLAHSSLVSQLLNLVWSIDIPNFPDIREFGRFFLFLLCGFNTKQFDKAFLPVITTNDPAGISVKMIIHYGQEIRSGKFRRYDHGIANIKYYKSLTPPDFNISAITAPVALYYSQNDFFAAVKDVQKLASQLPNLTKMKLIEDKRFSHIDFIWATDVDKLLNNEVISSQNEFLPKPKSAANRNISKYTLYTLILLSAWNVIFK